MKLNTNGLILWAWSILGDAVEGFAHGAVIGTGISAVEPGVQLAGQLHPFVTTMVVGGAVGALKQAMIYIGSNPLPPLLIPSTPAASV